MDVGAILEAQAQEIAALRRDINDLKRQETPIVSLENALLAAQDGRIGAAEAQLAQMTPTALAWAIYHAAPLLFPNLVGVWYMNQIASAQIWDATSQGRHLTRNGSFSFANINSLIRYAVFNGTDSYANRASEAALQITNNLSIMTWTYHLVAGTQQSMLAKTQSLSGNTDFAYWLLKGSADNLNFSICNGSTIKNITKAAPIGAWHFGAGAYAPSSTVRIHLGTQDGWEFDSDADSIPASINTAAATDLTIGALHGGTNVHNGYTAMVAIMNSSPGETLFRNYFEFTKGLFYGFN